MKRLPAIQQKTAEFTDVLDKHIAENRLLTNFSAWMVKLTIDFISTSMFDRDFHTINHVESDIVTDGEVYLTQLPITTKVKLSFKLTLVGTSIDFVLNRGFLLLNTAGIHRHANN